MWSSNVKGMNEPESKVYRVWKSALALHGLASRGLWTLKVSFWRFISQTTVWENSKSLRSWAKSVRRRTYTRRRRIRQNSILLYTNPKRRQTAKSDDHWKKWQTVRMRLERAHSTSRSCIQSAMHQRCLPFLRLFEIIQSGIWSWVCMVGRSFHSSPCLSKSVWVSEKTSFHAAPSRITCCWKLGQNLFWSSGLKFVRSSH